jgi:hypothetical protein
MMTAAIHKAHHTTTEHGLFVAFALNRILVFSNAG